MSSISLEAVDSDAATQSLVVLICNIFWLKCQCVHSFNLIHNWFLSALCWFDVIILTRFHPWLVLTRLKRMSHCGSSPQWNGYEWNCEPKHYIVHMPTKRAFTKQSHWVGNIEEHECIVLILTLDPPPNDRPATMPGRSVQVRLAAVRKPKKPPTGWVTWAILLEM